MDKFANPRNVEELNAALSEWNARVAQRLKQQIRRALWHFVDDPMTELHATDHAAGFVPLKPYISAAEQRRRDVADLVREDHESKRDAALVRAIGRALGGC